MSDLEKSFDAWIHASPDARTKFVTDKLEKIELEICRLDAERDSLKALLGKSKPGRKPAPRRAETLTAAPVPAVVEDIAGAVLSVISELGENGASRSDVQAKLGISDGQWTRTVKELGKRLKVKGERRATRYFVAGKK